MAALIPPGLKQVPLTCSGHTRPVVDLAFSDITPFGYFLISACKDGLPMIRQGDTGDWVGTLKGHKGAVWGATLDRCATKAATGAADYTAKVWDACTGEELESFAHKHIVKCVAFSGDGCLLLTGSNEKVLRVFDLDKPNAEPTQYSGHTSNLRRALFFPDQKRFISASDDKTLRVWDIASQSEVKKIEFPAVPADIEINKDGTIFSVPYGRKVSFWNVDTLEKVHEIEVPSQTNTASLHPDKDVVVCGGEDFKVYKFDYATGIEQESYKGHFGPVHSVRFSPDGELYATGSEDGTLRLWQTTVGRTYGLWQCDTSGSVDLPEAAADIACSLNNIHIQ